MEQDQVPQDNEERGSWLKQVSAAVEKTSFVSRRASRTSFKVSDVAETAPREYICPISLELMRDPVLLVETGQVYDRSSIEGWFKAGKSTCPVSGAKVKQMRLSSIFPLRSAIQSYAKQHTIQLEPVESASDHDDSPKAEAEMSGTLFDGVSVYDVRALCQLVSASDTEHQTTALKLLADMSRFGDSCQRLKIQRLVNKEKVATILNTSSIDSQRIQSARLLLNLPGNYFDLARQIDLLLYNNLLLREEVLIRIWKYAYRHRSKMFELASVIEKNHPDEIVAVCKKMADPTDNTDISDEIRGFSTFVLACTSFKRPTRRVAVDQEITPMFVNRLHATSNLGFRFCLLKALQYMAEDAAGRNQVIRAGGVRIFVTHLPPRNKTIQYSTRVYMDWFSWVTVAETAVKALYYLAFEGQGRAEMRTTATMKGLRLMVNCSSFPDSCRSRYSYIGVDASPTPS